MEGFDSLDKFFSSLNPVATKFREVDEYRADIDRQIEKNRVGFSSEYSEETSFSPDGSPNYGDPTNAFGFSSSKITFNLPTDSKKQKVLFYRTMALYPEISNALDIISDEAIVKDSEGRVGLLKMNKEIPSDINRLFHKEFDYIMDGVFRANEGELKNLFKKFLTDSELFVEYIKGDKDKDGIIGYQILPSYRTYPVYGHNGLVDGFIYKAPNQAKNENNDIDIIPFEKNQIGYATWEKGAVYNVRGYLEIPKRAYNQLLHLEDSVVVYRLVRAPERRLWNVEMGRVGNAKAEEYLNAVMRKYQRTLYYNPTDGKIDAQKTIQSMSEDYWFAKKEGQGTDVTLLQSGMNLGEINDINYILGKLYKALKLPITRWDPQLIGSNYQSGKQIEREELKFSYFVDDAKTKFIPIIKEAFINHIVFKYRDFPNICRWVKKRNIFNIELVQSNYFREYKDMERMTDRINLLSSLNDLIINPNNPETLNNPLSRKWVLTNPAIFGMNEDEWAKNEEMRQQEIADMLHKQMLGSLKAVGGGEATPVDMGSMGGADMGGGALDSMGGTDSGAPPEPETPPNETSAPETSEPESVNASFDKSFNKALKYIFESTPNF